MVAISADATRILGAVAQATIDGLTIARVRGLLQLTLDTAGSAADGFVGAVGLCIAPENAVGVGITAIPHPVADLEWDGWLWHSFFRISGGLGTGDFSGMASVPVDGKAKRKLTEDDALVAVLECTEIGAATMNVFFDSRMLVYMP